MSQRTYAPIQQKLWQPPLKSNAVQIRRVTTAFDETKVIATQVLAFGNDPVARWLYPDPLQYLTYFPQFVRTFGNKALEHKTTYFADRYIGAAFWFPPSVEPDGDPLIDLLENSVAKPEQDDLFQVLEEMSHFHPHQPHWYLAILGVEPTQQGKGYGSALLQPILQECDRTDTPAYLESSKPDNLPFYNRYGFEQIGLIQVGSSPPIFPMLRLPR